MHGFQFRLNWEKEESDASPFHPINAVEEAVSEKVHGGATIDGRPELAGEGHEGATGHGFPIRKHTEREEGNTYPTQGKTRLEGRLARGADGGAMTGPDGALRTTARGAKNQRKWDGEEEGGGTRSPRRRTGAETARNDGFARRAANSGNGFLRTREWEQSRGERGKKWGEVRRLARGGVLQATEARGKEGIVGAGFGLVVSNRERLGGGAVGGRGWS